MKTQPLTFLLTAACSLLGSAAFLLAQGPLSTGVIDNVSKENGTLVLRGDANQPAQIVYHGMDRAQIVTATGKAATLADLKPGLQATVFYAKQGDRWVVSRVLIPDEAPLPPITEAAPAILPRAAVDGDRTTQPGSRATIDDDRTTQPGQKAAVDGDRTTQPGSKAAIDADRTTQPGNNAATDGDRTTQPGSNTARSDADRTKRGPDNAATDGDRTTVPARR